MNCLFFRLWLDLFKNSISHLIFFSFVENIIKLSSFFWGGGGGGFLLFQVEHCNKQNYNIWPFIKWFFFNIMGRKKRRTKVLKTRVCTCIGHHHHHCCCCCCTKHDQGCNTMYLLRTNHHHYYQKKMNIF